MIIVLLLLDFIYLSIFKNFFFRELSKIHKPKLNIPAIVMCYLFIWLGYSYFLHDKTPIDAFILGIVIYGVYEFTSMGVFPNWSVKMAIMDILWGGILFALTMIISKWIQSYIKKN